MSMKEGTAGKAVHFSLYQKAAQGKLSAADLPQGVYQGQISSGLQETKSTKIQASAASCAEPAGRSENKDVKPLDVSSTTIATRPLELYADEEIFFKEVDLQALPAASSAQVLSGTVLPDVAVNPDLSQEHQAVVQVGTGRPARESCQRSKDKDCKEALYHPGSAVRHYLGAEGVLAQKQPYFRERSGQLQMAQAVLQTLGQADLLLAEAGTGTGKTFAYLIPALINNSTVVISTGSKALQDQLVKHDIPRLLQQIGRTDIAFMGLKGFNNYLCMRRYKQAVLSGELTAKQKTAVESYVASEEQLLLQNPYASSFCDVNARFAHEVADRLTVSRKRCLGDKCEYCADSCFPLKARRYAAESRIVVINHALLFAALSSRQLLNADRENISLQSLSLEDTVKLAKSGLFEQHYWFLPNFNALICDEAHMLPAFGRNFYAVEFDTRELLSWSDNLLRELNLISFAGRGLFKDAIINLRCAYSAALDYLSFRQGRLNFLELKYLNYAPVLPPEQQQLNQDFRRLMAELYRSLKHLSRLIKDHREFNSDLFAKFAEELKELMDGLVAAMNCDKPGEGQDENHVCCATIEAKYFVFTLIPIEIGPYFGKDLSFMKSSGTGIVMTSATLSVNGNFNKFSFDIGSLPLKPATLIVDSIFDYKKQACLYLSGDFPAVQDEGRNEKLLNKLCPLIDTLEGGAFFLTTSHRSLKESAIFLEDYFRNKRPVLVQAGGKSNAQIMHEFRKAGNAVLVGTSSFWAGVDVPGQALSLVIIDKLPFASPADPFEQARADKLKHSGGSPFMQLSLPEAIIALRQGVGRLIRTEQDKGGLIICDPRVCTARYGKQIIDALPQMHLCHNLDEFKKFFVGLHLIRTAV